MTSKNILNINQKEYRRLLRRILKHDCYINTFNSTRRAEEAEPTIDDFTRDVETLNISLPFPITEAGTTGDDIDHCKALLIEKQQYSNKLDSFLQHYKKDKKWLTKKYVRETKYGMLPKYVFDLSVKNLQDPDVHFNGNYNWYYTGGVLDMCNIFNEQYLIYMNNTNLCLTNSKGQNHSIKLNILEKTPIFNINAVSERNTIVSIRQKHKVYLLELTLINDELTFEVLTSKKTPKIPYIDFKYHDNETCSLKLDRQLQIQHLDSKVCDKYTFEDTSPSDSFGQIEYLDNNSIITLDRKWIRIFDKRSKQEQMCVIKDDDFKCNELCTFALSDSANHIFLAAMHDIFKVDLRQLNIVKKWSHMLSSAPSMIKVNNYYDNELIFLSSQNYDDRIILLSNENESHLVQMVPNNIETLTKCNKTYNLNLYNDNMKRLKYSTVGMGILQSCEGIELYTCNSVGDIFKNDVTQKCDISTEPLEKLDKWINSFPKVPKQLIVSDVREMSGMKDFLENPVDTKTLDRYTKENRKRLELLSDMTVEDVDMAAIWLTDDRPREEDLLPSTSSRNKVSEWLQKREELSSDDEKTKIQYIE